MYDERAVETDEAEATKPAIRTFIQQRFPDVACFMTTLRKDGRPSIRQVSTFVEGWNVGTITQTTHVKNLHIRHNPIVTYLWLSLSPNQYRSVQNVMLQGTCEIVTDQDEVRSFLERRAAATGSPVPVESYHRWLLRTTPTLVRAEGFTGPRRPVLLSQF